MLIIAILPTMMGCAFLKPNDRILQGAKTEWESAIGPELQEYIIADTTAPPETIAQLNEDIATYETFLAEDAPWGIVINKRWREEGHVFALPVTTAYLKYVEIDESISDRLKDVLRRTAVLHTVRWCGIKRTEE